VVDVMVVLEDQSSDLEKESSHSLFLADEGRKGSGHSRRRSGGGGGGGGGEDIL